MPLFIQEIFIERLLFARRCWKGWDAAGNQTDRNCPCGLTFARGTHRNRMRCHQGHREDVWYRRVFMGAQDRGLGG